MPKFYHKGFKIKLKKKTWEKSFKKRKKAGGNHNDSKFIFRFRIDQRKFHFTHHKCLYWSCYCTPQITLPLIPFAAIVHTTFVTWQNARKTSALCRNSPGFPVFKNMQYEQITLIILQSKRMPFSNRRKLEEDDAAVIWMLLEHCWQKCDHLWRKDDCFSSVFVYGVFHRTRTKH